MAGNVDESYSTTAVPGHSEEDDSALRIINATVSKQYDDPERTLSPNSWGVVNGSLPVPLPTNQAGPGFHYVESSTTDSGVSNASSITSDSLPAGETSLPTAELHFELTTVEKAIHSRDLERSGGELRVSELCVPESGETGEVECDDLSSDLRDLSTSEGPQSSARNTNGRGAGEDDGSSCSFSLDSSRLETQEHRLPEGLISRSGDSGGAGCTMSLASFSMDSQSVSGVSISEERSPDTVSLSHMPRRGSSGPGWVGSRGLRSVFTRTNRNKLSYVGSVDTKSQGMIAASSTTGLILQGRPQTLPAKSAAEEKRHRKLYDEMVTAARRKELQRAKEMIEKEKQRRQRDKMVTDSLREWQKVLPNWDNMKSSRRVKELWWLGLPPGIRGKVWRKAIGNDLNISPELYQISLTRCREKLATMESRPRAESTGSLTKGINREQSVEVIHLDVLRTFPTLGFFQEGGPYNQVLHDVLGAYACYRPDVGYVQGMSFLAAVLLLNMEASDAFVSLANLLNRSSYLAFFRVDHDLMQPYFTTFTVLLQEYLPRVHEHFAQMEFSPEYYLIDWIFTMYTRTFPLDVACRVWDLFCRDGDCFLFRTALGVLRLFQNDILERHTIEEVGQFLGHLPDTVDSNVLFRHIVAINLTSKKFVQCLQQHTCTSS